MKSKLWLLLTTVCTVLIFAGLLAPSVAGKTDTAILPERDSINAARFLNMLNHNSSYNEDFASVGKLVDNATVQLLDLRDAEDEDYIAPGFVADYMKNMYGIQIGSALELNPQYPQKDGFVFINPCGFTEYTHEFVSMKENDDGSIEVVTSVTVDYHDDIPRTLSCTTLFAVNEQSDFGYNIVYSDINIGDTI